MNININTREIDVGVVGLGLMGSSVVTALLISGHKVKAIAPLAIDMVAGPKRIKDQLRHCQKAELLSEDIDSYLSRLTVTEDYASLSSCQLILECVIEEIEVKDSVYKKITDHARANAVIASNTSAIPISQLQRHVVNPERFLGIHWAEPAYMTRFMEITCGEKTLQAHAAWVFELAHHWSKEPTLLRKDIRGFVTNRLMYAIYREMFSLIEKGEATVESVDKAFRYDAGSWMTLMGVFRRLDYVGFSDHYEIFKNVFPTLSNEDGVPAMMQQMVKEKLRGTLDASGLYNYTPGEARAWDEAFAMFNKDIYKLAALYPYDSRRTKATHPTTKTVDDDRDGINNGGINNE